MNNEPYEEIAGRELEWEDQGSFSPVAQSYDHCNPENDEEILMIMMKFLKPNDLALQ